MNDYNYHIKLPFSAQKAFFIMGFLVLFVYAIIQAKGILIPFTYAVLLSFILYPMCNFFEEKGVHRIVAIILSFSVVILGLSTLFYFFSTQVVNIVEEFDDFRGKLLSLLHQVTEAYNAVVPNSQLDEQSLISEVTKWLSKSGSSLASGAFNQTTNFLSGLLIVPIYVFLLLLYRSGIRLVLLRFVKREFQSSFAKLLYDTQKVGQNYVGGLVLLILILGVLNSIALWVIGIDSPFFFGFFASCLAIIPYVGTISGAMLPALYALFNHGNPAMALAVIIAFWGIQVLDGNFLSPKIIGGEVSLNPLTAIVSIIVGGYVWGVSGMILFLPLAAILRIICTNYVELEPIAQLMGDEITFGEAENTGVKAEKQKPFWKKLFK